MKHVATRESVRAELAPHRAAGETIGLVPTMGFLHEGHASLIRAARTDCDVVVVSAFVNPAQFRPGEDLESYPRDTERDVKFAAGAGADLLYAPAAEEVYPEGFATRISVSGLTEFLEGHTSQRGPEHFDGVTTVVAKLFNTVGPDIAFFGQKDAQQAVVIRRMVRDLDFGVRIAVLPTVREPDGLALSSRNVNLDESERRQAAILSRALSTVASQSREVTLAEALAAARAEMEAAGVQPEYLEARDAENLSAASELNGRPVLVAVAARIGKTRLIDNLTIVP